MTRLLCDTHMHFYDEAYPASPDSVLFPPNATPDDYRQVQQVLGLTRVVVVQPTTYGLDNRCQLDAMATFGDHARGVMVIDASTPSSEIRRLHELGVRGARFHMLPGGAVPWEQMSDVAAHIAPYGWHIQLQCNGRELAARFDELSRLPTPLVIDHVGRFMPPVAIEHDSFQALLRLVEAGETWLKLSAPYESSAKAAEVEPLIEALVERVPERLLWATNWPHPGQASPPSEATLQTQQERWLPPGVRDQVLVANPDELYFSS